jgi:hypothetical protein
MKLTVEQIEYSNYSIFDIKCYELQVELTADHMVIVWKVGKKRTCLCFHQ